MFCLKNLDKKEIHKYSREQTFFRKLVNARFRYVVTRIPNLTFFKWRIFCSTYKFLGRRTVHFTSTVFGRRIVRFTLKFIGRRIVCSTWKILERRIVRSSWKFFGRKIFRRVDRFTSKFKSVELYIHLGNFLDEELTDLFQHFLGEKLSCEELSGRNYPSIFYHSILSIFPKFQRWRRFFGSFSQVNKIENWTVAILEKL
jgi:hypothetical protein